MKEEGYSETVMDHFERPRNNGVLEGADAIGYMTNPVCGDALLLMLRIEGERIEEARWQSDGCAASIAASSLLSELLTGRSLCEAPRHSERKRGIWQLSRGRWTWRPPPAAGEVRSPLRARGDR